MISSYHICIDKFCINIDKRVVNGLCNCILVKAVEGPYLTKKKCPWQKSLESSALYSQEDSKPKKVLIVTTNVLHLMPYQSTSFCTFMTSTVLRGVLWMLTFLFDYNSNYVVIKCAHFTKWHNLLSYIFSRHSRSCFCCFLLVCINCLKRTYVKSEYVQHLD